LVACACDHALEHRHAGTYKLERSQVLGRHLKEDHRPVMLKRMLDQPRSEVCQVVETRPPEAERLHGLGEMVATRLLAMGILIEGKRAHVELAREERRDRRWRYGEVIGHEAKEAQRAQLEREAEAVRVAAPSSNEREVIERQPVVHREVDLEQLVGETRQSCAFILGEETSRHAAAKHRTPCGARGFTVTTARFSPLTGHSSRLIARVRPFTEGATAGRHGAIGDVARARRACTGSA